MLLDMATEIVEEVSRTMVKGAFQASADEVIDPLQRYFSCQEARRFGVKSLQYKYEMLPMEFYHSNKICMYI